MLGKKIFKRNLTAGQKELSKALYNIFGVKTDNIHVYELAFRHKSMSSQEKNKNIDSYERLEFLGDAVLGLIVAEHIFKKFPFKNEGFLTDLRSKIVCGKNLGKISQKLGLEKLIYINNQNINGSMFSALGDVFEAVIGAMYIDKGFFYTKKILIERIIKIHVDIDTLLETESNFKSRLIEWTQKEKKELIFKNNDFKIVQGYKQYSVQVLIEGEVISEAINNSIKAAEQLAAEKCIEILKKNGQYIV